MGNRHARQQRRLAVNTQEAQREFVAMGSLLVDRLTSLTAGAGKQFGTSRDLDAVYGYQKSPTIDDYINKARRLGLASRIVRAYPDATWREHPEVKEADKKGDKPTEFEKVWESITERLPVWAYAKRADFLAQLGRYSVLVLGFGDGADLSTPITKANADQLVWMMPLTEKSATIKTLNNDSASKRYMLPETYEVTIRRSDKPDSDTQAIIVHASRVIHIAEGLWEDDIYGTPRLQAVWDDLFDKVKVKGGAAEMFFQNGRGIMAAVQDKDARVADGDRALMETAFDDLMHRMRNFVHLQGIDLKPVQLEIADPKAINDVIIDDIAGASGIPKRILIGNEAGELASSQDENNWNARTFERRTQFAEPCIVHAILDRLKELGALPDVKYEAKWPEADQLGPEKRATVALAKAQALAAYTNAIGGDQVVTVEEFRERFLDLEPIPEGGFADDTEDANDDLAAAADPIDPAAPALPDGGTAGTPVTAPTVSLNGAQVSALLDIVGRVAAGELPRDSGVEAMIAAFALPREIAESIMGEVGRSFKPAVPEPAPAGGFV